MNAFTFELVSFIQRFMFLKNDWGEFRNLNEKIT